MGHRGSKSDYVRRLTIMKDKLEWYGPRTMGIFVVYHIYRYVRYIILNFSTINQITCLQIYKYKIKYNYRHWVTFAKSILIYKISRHVSSFTAFSFSRISFWILFCWQCPLVPCLTKSPFSMRYCLLWCTTAPCSIWNWQSALRGWVRIWNDHEVFFVLRE